MPHTEALSSPAPPPAPEIDAIVAQQMPQVHLIARQIHDRLPQSVEFDDLVHAGILGLLDAARKFDSNKQVQFKSYAQFRIRGAILDSLRALDWSPRHLRRKAREVENASRELEARLGRHGSEEEIAEASGMPLEEYQQLLGDLRGLSLGSLYTETDDGAEEVMLYCPTSPEEDPLYQTMRSEMRALLANAIEDLPEREKQVLALYYYEELNMKEIATVLAVGESRVSQIHSAAVLKLRSKLASAMENKPATRSQAH